MTPEQKKLLRDALLATLVTAAPISLPIGTLRNAARAAGFSLSDTEVEAHLDYLVDLDMATVTKERLSAGVRRWKAGAAGVEYCEGEGLV
jgi:hypothetical protein